MKHENGKGQQVKTGQQVRQLSTLFLSQFGWGSWWWLVAQRIRATFLRSTHPLAHTSIIEELQP